MINSREVKDTEQLRRFAAVGLIQKQQTGELTGEEKAMLNQFMGDPNVRAFVDDAIRKEAAADARAIAEAYKSSKSAAAGKGLDQSEVDGVAEMVEIYQKIKGSGRALMIS